MNPIETSSFGELFFSLAITASVLYLTYWTTRRLARKVQNTALGRQLQIVERIQLTRDRQIAVLKVGDTYFLAGITPQQIQFSQPIDYTPAEPLTPEINTGTFASGQERPWTKWLNRLK